MFKWGMNPQEALDAPRICISPGSPDGSIFVEDGIPQETLESLRSLGHEVYCLSGFNRRYFVLNSTLKTQDTKHEPKTSKQKTKNKKQKTKTKTKTKTKNKSKSITKNKRRNQGLLGKRSNWDNCEREVSLRL